MKQKYDKYRVINRLEDLYDFYKMYYKRTGRKEFPATLLAIKLCDKLDSIAVYEFGDGSNGWINYRNSEDFYERNKEVIDKAIDEVDRDFHFTENDYAKFLILCGEGLDENTFEEDITYQCYGNGFDFIAKMSGEEISNTIHLIKYFDIFKKNWEAGIFSSNIFKEGMKSFAEKTYEELEKEVKTDEDFFVDSSTFLIPKEPIKITLTNIEIDTLKECGNLTVLRQKDVPIEITLTDKEETPKQIIKKQNN